MAAILTPWGKRIIAPDGRVRPARGNQLVQGGVFLYHGHHDLEMIAGLQATRTGATKTTARHGRISSFAGGSEGAADLNFGTYAATASLHDTQSATWAFLARSHSPSSTALACQTDVNNDRGWQLGYVNSGLGLSFVRSGSNMRTSVTHPAADTWFSVVATFRATGSAPLASDVKIYVDGLDGGATGGDSAGTSGPATSESLYIGRRRWDTPLSHDGDVALGFIAQRVWSDAEARAWHDNPWQLFEASSNPVFSFVGQAIGAPSASDIAESAAMRQLRANAIYRM